MDADDRLLLDPAGFNSLRICRTGPILYNRFDRYVGGSLHRYGEFSFYEQALFEVLVGRGQVVVEAGANIGAHTVLLSRLVGPDGEVHAYEPQRIVFQTLCANVALNQCTNVYARQAALGVAAGAVVVPAPDPATEYNFGAVSLDRPVPDGELVPLQALDDLDLPACHFLKVDVEGMEVDVLRGAQRTIATYRPIMYLENDRDDRSEELLRLVLDLGYAAYWHLARLFNPENFDGVTEDIFPGVISANIACVPAESGMQIPGLRRVASARETWRG
jgi:FkbM family methyltransferase